MNTVSHPILTLPIVILAGGQSRRLQWGNYERKWQLPFGDSTLLQHMLNIASRVSNTVLINSATKPSDALLQYKYPIINDADSQGPLSGITAALHWGARNGHAAVMTLPCDTPFLSAQWLRHLYHQFCHCQTNAVISRSEERIHPLCGVWSTQLSADLATFMQSPEKKSVYRWANQHAQVIDYEKYNRAKNQCIDPFMNINTLKDYQNALQQIATIEE